MAQDIYLYVNVPFCLRRCPYCYCTLIFSDQDLLSWRNNSESYVESVLKEISEFSGEGKRCLGISFGGGTPTVLEVSQIERILNAAMNCCGSIDEKAQISIETFPGTKSRDEWKSLRSMGFNRASIGAQSFDDEELQFLGRAYNTKDIYKTYDDLCAAGFENINIDIMFGLPNGNLSRWMKSIDVALDLQTKHLTAYYWFVTRGSDFFNRIKKGLLRLPDSELSIEQYRYAINAAKEHGFRLYWDYNFSTSIEYEYAIERDMFRQFPTSGFGPNAWSQEGIIQKLNCPILQIYFMNPLIRCIRKFSVDVYMLRTLMYPQGMIFSEFEQLFNIRWSPKLMSGKLRKSFILWVDRNFIDIDNTGIRFKEKTWAQSAIYLAEFQTKAWYCPEKDLYYQGRISSDHFG